MTAALLIAWLVLGVLVVLAAAITVALYRAAMTAADDRRCLERGHCIGDDGVCEWCACTIVDTPPLP